MPFIGFTPHLHTFRARRLILPTGSLIVIPTRVGPGLATFGGTYRVTWTVPDDVYAISAVVVGGGGGAAFQYHGSRYYSGLGGGSGGGLMWRKHIFTTPGETLYLQAGQYGKYGFRTSTSTASETVYAPWLYSPGWRGGTSAIYRNDWPENGGTKLLAATGGIGRGPESSLGHPGYDYLGRYNPLPGGYGDPSDADSLLGTEGIDWGATSGGASEMANYVVGAGGGAGGYLSNGGDAIPGEFGGLVSYDGGHGGYSSQPSNGQYYLGEAGNGGGVSLYGSKNTSPTNYVSTTAQGFSGYKWSNPWRPGGGPGKKGSPDPVLEPELIDNSESAQYAVDWPIGYRDDAPLDRKLVSYGGGQGAIKTSSRYQSANYETPGPGAVRIIWGPGRSYPSTNTGIVGSEGINWG